ncbi:MAG: hypothetical protein NTW19_22870 [Planctomycetota bacterium]|nr:hypothetical protein [Planctomycetota bacterium]
MVSNLFLEDVARELLQKQADGGADLAALLPELIGLLEEGHDQPVDHLAPMIHRRILERSFVDENGDSVLDESLLADIDTQTKQALSLLQGVQTEAMSRGIWSSAPVTPLMCG